MPRSMAIFFVALTLLAACGGGGGNRNAPAAPRPEPMLQIQNGITPAIFSANQQGTPSNHTSALAKLRQLRTDDNAMGRVQRTFTSRITEPFITGAPLPIQQGLTNPILDLTSLPEATKDTNAEAAWRLGWTGKTAKVAIVDDFSTTSQRLNGNTHGDIVRAVAWQIAPEAEMAQQHINLLINGTQLQGVRIIYGDRALKAFDKAQTDGAHIVNASFGVDPYTARGNTNSAIDLSSYIAEIRKQAGFAKAIGPAAASTSYHPNMLFVIAAGNGARSCAAKSVSACTIEGGAVLEERKTEKLAGDRVIFVGALADGSTTQMAVYSYTAGDLKNDFIVAHDNIWQGADGAGTSFSAPRVTGAAALVRHKFPNLNGPQLKQVLLQTADDLGTPGVDDVFGHGKLNVLSALSPVGRLTSTTTRTTAPKGAASTYRAATGALRRYVLSGQNLPISGFAFSHFSRLSDETLLSHTNNAFFRPTRDTNADAAWRLGWTGKGVKVGHLDDFQRANVERPSHGDLTLGVTYQVAPEMAHTQRQLSFGCNLPAGTQGRQIRDAYQHFSDNGVHIVNNSFGVSRWRTKTCPGDRDAHLLNDATWQNWVNDTATGPVFLNMAGPQNTTTSYHPNMLFVFSAGNHGATGECTLGAGDCTLRAAAILKLRADGQTSAGERVLFVGSLADGQDDTLADYSISAGRMKNDYIVAHDDVFQEGVGAGTSFAAPRVTGAAALVRHKWPSLNGPQLKQVLLRSADDIGAPGVDEVFGHGRLNILGALSPIGGLTQ